jgi:hypothetical protein
MGFMDKAKKMAEQAQAKLEEAQKQFNQGQGGQPASSGPQVEYDQHGRPVPSSPSDTASPPQGDPVAGPAPTTEADGPAGPVPTGGPGGPVPDPGAPSGPPPVAPPDLGTPSGPPPAAQAPRPQGDPVAAAPPAAPPARPGSQGAPEDRNHPSYEPPTLTSGDPLAG